eukprot:tig00020553_g10574.t1
MTMARVALQLQLRALCAVLAFAAVSAAITNNGGVEGGGYLAPSTETDFNVNLNGNAKSDLAAWTITAAASGDRVRLNFTSVARGYQQVRIIDLGASPPVLLAPFLDVSNTIEATPEPKPLAFTSSNDTLLVLGSNPDAGSTNLNVEFASTYKSVASSEPASSAADLTGTTFGTSILSSPTRFEAAVIRLSPGEQRSVNLPNGYTFALLRIWHVKLASACGAGSNLTLSVASAGLNIENGVDHVFVFELNPAARPGTNAVVKLGALTGSATANLTTSAKEMLIIFTSNEDSVQSYVSPSKSFAGMNATVSIGACPTPSPSPSPSVQPPAPPQENRPKSTSYSAVIGRMYPSAEGRNWTAPGRTLPRDVSDSFARVARFGAAGALFTTGGKHYIMVVGGYDSENENFFSRGRRPKNNFVVYDIERNSWSVKGSLAWSFGYGQCAWDGAALIYCAGGLQNTWVFSINVTSFEVVRVADGITHTHGCMTFYRDRLWLWGGRLTFADGYDSPDQSCAGVYKKDGGYFLQDPNSLKPSTIYKTNTLYSFVPKSGVTLEKTTHIENSGSCQHENRVESPACARVGNKWFSHAGNGYLPAPETEDNDACCGVCRQTSTKTGVPGTSTAALISVDLDKLLAGEQKRPVEIGSVGAPTAGHPLAACRNHLAVFSFNDQLQAAQSSELDLYAVYPGDQPSEPRFETSPAGQQKRAEWKPDLTKFPTEIRFKYGNRTVPQVKPPNDQGQRTTFSAFNSVFGAVENPNGECTMYIATGLDPSEVYPYSGSQVVTIKLAFVMEKPGRPQLKAYRAFYSSGAMANDSQSWLDVTFFWPAPDSPQTPREYRFLLEAATEQRNAKGVVTKIVPSGKIAANFTTNTTSIDVNALPNGSKFFAKVAACYADASCVESDANFIQLQTFTGSSFGATSPSLRSVGRTAGAGISTRALDSDAALALATTGAARTFASDEVLSAANVGASFSAADALGGSRFFIYEAKSTADCETIQDPIAVRNVRADFARYLEIPSSQVVVVSAACDISAPRLRRLHQAAAETVFVKGTVTVSLGVAADLTNETDVAILAIRMARLASAATPLGTLQPSVSGSGIVKAPAGYDMARRENAAKTLDAVSSMLASGQLAALNSVSGVLAAVRDRVSGSGGLPVPPLTASSAAAPASRCGALAIAAATSAILALVALSVPIF